MRPQRPTGVNAYHNHLPRRESPSLAAMQSSESTPMHSQPPRIRQVWKKDVSRRQTYSRAALCEPQPCPAQVPYAASRIRVQACRTYDYAVQTPLVDRSASNERPHKVRRRTRHLFDCECIILCGQRGVIGVGYTYLARCVREESVEEGWRRFKFMGSGLVNFRNFTQTGSQHCSTKLIGLVRVHQHVILKCTCRHLSSFHFAAHSLNLTIHHLLLELLPVLQTTVYNHAEQCDGERAIWPGQARAPRCVSWQSNEYAGLFAASERRRGAFGQEEDGLLSV